MLRAQACVVFWAMQHVPWHCTEAHDAKGCKVMPEAESCTSYGCTQGKSVWLCGSFALLEKQLSRLRYILNDEAVQSSQEFVRHGSSMGSLQESCTSCCQWRQQYFEYLAVYTPWWLCMYTFLRIISRALIGATSQTSSTQKWWMAYVEWHWCHRNLSIPNDTDTDEAWLANSII